MAVEVVMPKLGNEIESCVIVAWRKQAGDTVAKGEPVCEIETDKATFEVESPAAGVLLKVFFKEGDDVPVRATIAVIGQPGEDVSGFAPEAAKPESAPKIQVLKVRDGSLEFPLSESVGGTGVSPRARHAAETAGVDPSVVAGSGPGGRVIERDVRDELSGREPLTPAARDLLAAPRVGTGIGGRVLGADIPEAGGTFPVPDLKLLGPSKEIAVKGVRKAIASRLLHSARTTAQVTLHATADASALRTARARLKTEAATYGITINDLVMHATMRVLPKFPALNAFFLGERILQFEHVHLGVAVQTPRGLMAPVVRRADALSLIELSAEAKRVRQACLDGTATPQELTGATFTMTNLGPQGIEFFTPLLNPPEVAILGVGTIVVRPVEGRGGLRLVPHLGLSLTFDHQALDGHDAAVFLEAIGEAVARVDAGGSHG
ncbi:MAG: dihydrolipoamide acetyltransferase family protein [Candidatus Coatesbacteria bacterium]